MQSVVDMMTMAIIALLFSIILLQESLALAVARIPLRRSTLNATSRSFRRQQSYRRNDTAMNDFRRVTSLPSNSSRPTPRRRATPASEVLHNVGDLGFYGTVSVGQPPQHFTVLFDTGSADFFLPSIECNSAICLQHRRFDALSSDTFDPLGDDPEGQKPMQGFEIGYGTGNVQGRLGMDVVSIAGLSVLNVLGLGDTLSEDFDDAPFDGIMGLAYPSLSVIGQPPPFSSMLAEGLVEQPLFSFWQSGLEGELILGAVDHGKYYGPLGYSPVVEQGYWMLDVQEFLVGGFDVIDPLETGRAPRRAIVDTGTTLLITTRADAAIIHRLIHPQAVMADTSPNFQGTYHIPCDTAILPTLQLSLTGGRYFLHPRDYVLQPIGNNLCLSGIAGQDIGTDEWIIGDVFLRTHYAVFDFGRNAVAFAPSIP